MLLLGGVMKELIICSDLHETSDDNIKSGISFAMALGLKPKIFHIDTISPQIERQFHVASVGPRRVKDPIWNETVVSTVLDMANAMITRLGITKDQVAFENFEGSIYEGIDHLKTHKDLEMMAIGATHHGAIHRFFLNTFAEKSFFHVNKDVYVTKRRCEKVSKITYLIPYEPLDEDDLSKVIHFAKCNGSSVHLDCVVPINFVGFNLEQFPAGPSPREMFTNELSQMHKFAEDELKKGVKAIEMEGIEASYSLKMILNKEPGNYLEGMIRDNETDLVIIKPQHSTFEHLSVGSITLDIMQKISCNLLLLRS